jgi:hypothetical protein
MKTNVKKNQISNKEQGQSLQVDDFVPFMTRQILKIKYFKLCPIIGCGYWKDVYKKENTGTEGVVYNFILPFIRIQLGYLVIEKS